MGKHLYGTKAWPPKKTTWGNRLTGKRIQFLKRRRTYGPQRHGRTSIF